MKKYFSIALLVLCVISILVLTFELRLQKNKIKELKHENCILKINDLLVVINDREPGDGIDTEGVSWQFEKMNLGLDEWIYVNSVADLRCTSFMGKKMETCKKNARIVHKIAMHHIYKFAKKPIDKKRLDSRITKDRDYMRKLFFRNEDKSRRAY